MKLMSLDAAISTRQAAQLFGRPLGYLLATLEVPGSLPASAVPRAAAKCEYQDTSSPTTNASAKRRYVGWVCSACVAPEMSR